MTEFVPPVDCSEPGCDKPNAMTEEEMSHGLRALCEHHFNVLADHEPSVPRSIGYRACWHESDGKHCRMLLGHGGDHRHT